jgi:predicted RNase H-like nuclease (RuvC/YqgF family)
MIENFLDNLFRLEVVVVAEDEVDVAEEEEFQMVIDKNHLKSQQPWWAEVVAVTESRSQETLEFRHSIIEELRYETSTKQWQTFKELH